MNAKQYLLVCLAEECAEVSQEVGKALRFGIEHDWPGDKNQGTNAQRIEKELTDLFAVFEMLVAEGVFPPVHCGLRGFSASAIEAKKEKVRQFMHYAREKGTLE